MHHEVMDTELEFSFWSLDITEKTKPLSWAHNTLAYQKSILSTLGENETSQFFL